MEKIGACIVSLFIFSLASATFANDVPPSGSVLLSKVVDNIYSKGYETINKIEYDDGVYKAKVVNKDGQSQYLYIDPTTGNVPVSKKEPIRLNMSEALEKLPENKCKTITEVKSNKSAFKIECLSLDNHELEISLDPVSGKVLRIQNDD